MSENQKHHGSTEEHHKLVKDFILEVGMRYADVRAIPYGVGTFRVFKYPDIITKVGQVGIPDIIVFGPNWYFFLDAKTGDAIYSPEQRNWKNVMDAINQRETMFKLKTIQQGCEIVDRFLNIKSLQVKL